MDVGGPPGPPGRSPPAGPAGADLRRPLGVATSAVRAPGAAARALLDLIDSYVR